MQVPAYNLDQSLQQTAISLRNWPILSMHPRFTKRKVVIFSHKTFSPKGVKSEQFSRGASTQVWNFYAGHSLGVICFRYASRQVILSPFLNL